MLTNACFLLEGKGLIKSGENRVRSNQTGTVFLAAEGKGLIRFEGFLCLPITP